MTRTDLVEAQRPGRDAEALAVERELVLAHREAVQFIEEGGIRAAEARNGVHTGFAGRADSISLN